MACSRFHSTRYFLSTCSVTKRRSTGHTGEPSGSTVATFRCADQSRKQLKRRLESGDIVIYSRFLLPAGSDVQVGDTIASGAAPATDDYREITNVSTEGDHLGHDSHMVVEVAA